MKNGWINVEPEPAPSPAKKIQFQRYEIMAYGPDLRISKFGQVQVDAFSERTTEVVIYRATDFMDALRYAQKRFPGKRISLRNAEHVKKEEK